MMDPPLSIRLFDYSPDLIPEKRVGVVPLCERTIDVCNDLGLRLLTVRIQKSSCGSLPAVEKFQACLPGSSTRCPSPSHPARTQIPQRVHRLSRVQYLMAWSVPSACVASCKMLADRIRWNVRTSCSPTSRRATHPHSQ